MQQACGAGVRAGRKNGKPLFSQRQPLHPRLLMQERVVRARARVCVCVCVCACVLVCHIPMPDWFAACHLLVTSLLHSREGHVYGLLETSGTQTEPIVELNICTDEQSRSPS